MNKNLMVYTPFIIIYFWRSSPHWARASPFVRFLDHTHRRTKVGRTPLDESQRPLPDNTHNTHNRQISMPPVGFEPTISAGERPQTYALDRVPAGIGDTQSNTKISVMNRDHIYPYFPRTVPVLWVLESSVSVSRKIRFRIPNVPAVGCP